MQVCIPHVYVSTCGRNITVMLYWRVTRAAACVGRARCSLPVFAYMRHSVCGVVGVAGLLACLTLAVGCCWRGPTEAR